MRPLETYSVHRVAPGEDLESICQFYDVDPDDVRRLNSLPQPPVVKVGQELNIPIRTLRKVGPSLYKIAGKDTKVVTTVPLGSVVGFTYSNSKQPLWNSPTGPAEIVHLDEQHANAAAGSVPGKPRSVYAAAYNGEVKVGHCLMIRFVLQNERLARCTQG